MRHREPRIPNDSERMPQPLHSSMGGRPIMHPGCVHLWPKITHAYVNCGLLHTSGCLPAGRLYQHRPGRTILRMTIQAGDVCMECEPNVLTSETLVGGEG